MIKYILIALAIGVLVGYLNNNYVDLIPNIWVSGYLFDFSLVALLFLMGFVFAVDKSAVSNLRKAGVRILAVPFAVAVGSIVGGLIGGLVLGIDLFGSMAVSAGYGWYTLAGPLVGQLFGSNFGALGFVVNFLRELLTFVTVSVSVKLDRYAPVACGGATAMDTTLPVIVRYSGSGTLITAFSSGFILSIVAPVSITMIASVSH